MCDDCEYDEVDDGEGEEVTVVYATPTVEQPRARRLHPLDFAILGTQFVGNVAEDLRLGWHGLTNMLIGHRAWIEEQRNFQNIVKQNFPEVSTDG